MITRENKQQFILDTFRPDDEAEILDMNLQEYGPRDSIVTPDAFHWLFAENPDGMAEITIARNPMTGTPGWFHLDDPSKHAYVWKESRSCTNC